ncbi:MAG: hypothetical protein IT381_25125 [Deltaproteobacteria bacterium]|nr:hypothetical protein [Deltaproteobacteria bacterium]
MLLWLLLPVIAASAPLEVQVFVPLCDSAIIDCGNKKLGDPASLDTNLYWGAAYGADRYLAAQPAFARLPSASPSKPAILKVTRFSRQPKRGERTVNVELLAYHGAQIDVALADYFAAVAGPSSADVVLWMGHDRLMDVAAPALSAGASPKPTLVLACASESYFGPALKTIGANRLAMTRSLMAPEAYLLVAALETFATKGTTDKAALRAALVDAYAKFQKISAKAAGSVFVAVRDLE